MVRDMRIQGKNRFALALLRRSFTLGGPPVSQWAIAPCASAEERGRRTGIVICDLAGRAERASSVRDFEPAGLEPRMSERVLAAGSQRLVHCLLSA